MVTGFVFVMMLVIEYINVLSSGKWQQSLALHKMSQYVLAGFLGAVPGCLGAFVVVAMYSHRLLSLGAVVTAMITTTGDEAFIMLAMIPKEALILTCLLFIIGIIAGFLADLVMEHKGINTVEECKELPLHSVESCRCYPKGNILQQWKQRSPFRTTLTVGLAIFFIAVALGEIGPPEWNWIRVSILIVSALALFVVTTVPDHFLEEHLWDHVVRKHVPRIFIWTFGTLLVMYFLIHQLHLDNLIRDNQWTILLVASLVGLIPESGPHLVFVTLYSQGIIPISILFASSIVQDGHGMLPLLAQSRRSFLVVKAINFIVGLSLGALVLSMGY